MPALEIDGKVLTENPAIIYYLNKRFPGVNLLPETNDDYEQAQQLADLSFCASTLHPIVTRLRLPNFFAGEAAAREVWNTASDAMDEYFQLVEDRLNKSPWWFGENWSAIDAYLYWIFWRVEGAGYQVERYPNFIDHKSRSESRTSVQKALAREAEAEKILAAENLDFKPPKIL